MENSDSEARDAIAPTLERSSESGASASQRRKKAYRFAPGADIVLLIEAIKHSPWAAPHGDTTSAWADVASDVSASLPSCTADGKACRRRFTTLMETFRREEMDSLRASGTVEEYSEREQLLTDCKSLVSVYTFYSAHVVGIL